MFDDLGKAILNNSTNNNNNNNSNESDSENGNESVNKDENESENESENENENENKNKNENKNESNDEQYYEIRQLNNWFKTIDHKKSLEEQLKLLKEKEEFFGEYWYVEYYHGNKELNYKIFKAKAAYLLSELDEQLFEKIFGRKFATLVDKLINTTSKEENQMLINDIKKNKDKIFEQDEFNKFVIQASHNCGNLFDAVKIILEFNETAQLNLT